MQYQLSIPFVNFALCPKQKVIIYHFLLYLTFFIFIFLSVPERKLYAAKNSLFFRLYGKMSPFPINLSIETIDVQIKKEYNFKCIYFFQNTPGLV